MDIWSVNDKRKEVKPCGKLLIVDAHLEAFFSRATSLYPSTDKKDALPSNRVGELCFIATIFETIDMWVCM